ncbi:Tellurite resistance TerB [Deinococcus detaillensis]|uniref:Tellurite resistance TerB n=1 Tax=Deinococcus detaillensis TaxID=2592048 RepID=A0A553V4K8_9DEIO|nr:TerB family tellurite resistance protein [Deinococcus detaillensis]TSA87324.1 Tellurite resistance TerB [Deinococcus detaillensis]
MGFLDQLKTLANQGVAATQEGFSRFNNATFADASMAACALIAAADGKIDTQERSRTAAFITSSDKLKSFDVGKLRDKYDAYCDKVTNDFDFGKIELIQVVGKAAKKQEEARAVVQLAVVIANADGNFDEKEQMIMRDIIYALKLQPSEFGL